MSIRSKFNEDEIRNLDKEKYMYNVSFDDIMQYSDKVFDVAALIRESTDSEEQQRAFSDALIRIKQESLAEKNKNWDPADMGALQELVKAKKDLEELGRKRQQLHISFE